MVKKTATNSSVDGLSSVLEIIGSLPLLPGESSEKYAQARALIIEELAAKTILQVYLAEKILGCLWWMTRYEQQKLLLVANAMVDRLIGFSVSVMDEGPRAALLDLVLHRSDSAEFQVLLKQKKLSIDSLRERAMSVNREALLRCDQLIALQAKYLEGFQRSYEHVTHRKLHAEQLSLSLELLRWDVRALEKKVSKGKTLTHGKSEDGLDTAGSR
jgi:hypothetical protein